MRRIASFRFSALAGAALLAAGMFSPIRAQDADDMQRGVARISLMNGEVSVRRGDSGEWVAGVINAPLLTDDRVSTGPNSRAEIQFDAGNVLRIGGNAEVHLSQLEAGRFQMELAHGTVTYNVVRPSTANAEVDTPTVSVRPSKQGIYRISVAESGETEVMARAGEVEVYTPRGSQWVATGQMMVARGSADNPEFQMVNAPLLDDWDRWNEDRDRALAQSTSAQYVPPGVDGAEDLDNYGAWSEVPPYGRVWHPTVGVGADWAPYQSGRWVWEDWYGWTWVSYDPWGWAPYHYGRWFSDPRFGWCWYPGAFGFRHFWSPALVGFFGFGVGGGFGFGFGNVGWVPLAPFEVFHPWWGRGFYGRGSFGANITNINVSTVYRNARVANGISGVSAADFRSGRFSNVGRFSGSQIREAGMVRGQLPISPSSANLRLSDRSVANVPRSSGNTRFFSHQQANPAQRMPFSQQQRGFGAANGGGSPAVNRGAVNRGAVNQGAVNQGSPQAQAGSRGAQSPANSGASGWRRFGAPGEGGSAAASNRASENTRPPNASSGAASGAASANRNGWSRFGDPSGGSRQANSGSPSGGSGYSTPRYSAPNNSRPSAPTYSAPRQSAPSYSAPRSAPSYSAPRSSGGGGSYSAPRSSGGGGGGGHSSGGGGGSHGHR